jgi:hypothetical protein
MTKPFKYFLTFSVLLAIIITYNFRNELIKDRIKSTCDKYGEFYQYKNKIEAMEECDKEIMCHTVRNGKDPICKPFYDNNPLVEYGAL